jgi:hypothetical protein
MATIAGDFALDWDERALATYLAGIQEGLLEEIVPQVEQVARDLAPVRTRHTPVPSWAKRGYVGTPGRLKASVHSEYGIDTYGPYGDVVALWYGRFLDPKARQLHRLYPFLPTALYTTVAGRVYYPDRFIPFKYASRLSSII